MNIDGITVNKSITLDRVMKSVENRRMSTNDSGICISCGFDQDGCEPDARKLECELCGEKAVYGVEDLFMELM